MTQIATDAGRDIGGLRIAHDTDWCWPRAAGVEIDVLVERTFHKPIVKRYDERATSAGQCRARSGVLYV